MQATTKNRNVWIPASLYWDNRQYLNLAYLPYFSNCDGYGQYIPLWALLEQNDQCEQVSLEETIFMGEFSFGQKPHADNCDEIVIQCIYDEIPADSQPLPRWFEQQPGENIFDLITDPVDYNDFMNKTFTGFQILAVGPNSDSVTGGSGSN